MTPGRRCVPAAERATSGRTPTDRSTLEGPRCILRRAYMAAWTWVTPTSFFGGGTVVSERRQRRHESGFRRRPAPAECREAGLARAAHSDGRGGDRGRISARRERGGH